MPPAKLHLIRHAEGFHNLCVENHAIRDPLLTPKGVQQCDRLSRESSEVRSVQCIVASPLRRALYTALNVFRDVLRSNPGLRILALPELQETASIQADIGMTREELEVEFQQHPIDFSRLTNDWNNKTSGPFAPRTDLLTIRGHSARRFLQSRHEDVIAVVTHGAFLHFLTEDWADSMTGDGTGWANCELRTYVFDVCSSAAIANATIAEINTSLTSQNRNTQLLTADEQARIRVMAQKTWAALGYIVLSDDVAI